MAVLLDGDSYEIAWVGDSRAYLWDGRLSLLTRDHSYVEAQLALGLVVATGIANHHTVVLLAPMAFWAWVGAMASRAICQVFGCQVLWFA